VPQLLSLKDAKIVSFESVANKVEEDKGTLPFRPADVFQYHDHLMLIKGNNIARVELHDYSTTYNFQISQEAHKSSLRQVVDFKDYIILLTAGYQVMIFDKKSRKTLITVHLYFQTLLERINDDFFLTILKGQKKSHKIIIVNLAELLNRKDTFDEIEMEKPVVIENISFSKMPSSLKYGNYQKSNA